MIENTFVMYLEKQVIKHLAEKVLVFSIGCLQTLLNTLKLFSDKCLIIFSYQSTRTNVFFFTISRFFKQIFFRLVNKGDFVQ